MSTVNIKDDARAASPVIGSILMVSITVILAAVVGTVVLGLTESLNSDKPLTNFDFQYNRTDGDKTCFEYNPGYYRQDSFGQDALYNYCNSVSSPRVAPGNGGILTITHTGGETIAADQLYVFGTSTYGTAAYSDSECIPYYSPTAENCNSDRELNYNASDTVTPGDRLEIWIRDSDSISIVWASPGGGQSAVLARYNYR